MTVMIDTTNYADGASPVTAKHFGGVYTSFHGLTRHDQQADQLGATHVRWPGGYRAEYHVDQGDRDMDGDVAEYLYDLKNAEVLLVPGKGLSDVLVDVNADNAAFTMVAPTIRYFGDPASAYADLRDFVARLLNGDFGPVPADFTLELGNESTGTTVAEAQAYGEIANAQIAAIRDALADPAINPNGADLKIAIQMGQSNQLDSAVRNEIDPANLAEIDAVIDHHLTLNLRTFNIDRASNDTADDGESIFERNVEYVANWEAAVGAARGDTVPASLDYHVTEWTVGNAEKVSDAEMQFQDYGARQGRTTLDTFAQMIGTGVDVASLWGIDARANDNWFSKWDNGAVQLSHGGEVFRLLSESVVGTRLVAGFEQPVSWNSSDGDAPFWTYTFDSADKTVIFLAANDLAGATDVTIELGNITGIESIQFDAVRTVMDSSYTAGDIARLHEIPQVATGNVDFGGNAFTYTLTEDFEVVRFVIDKSDAATEASLIRGSRRGDTLDGSTFHDKIKGLKGNDRIDADFGDDVVLAGSGRDFVNGGAGNDVIKAGGGNDKLFGGAGNDVLVGGGGRDRLDGGAGDDLLIGGRSRDLFVFNANSDHDTIAGFNRNQDMLVFEGVSRDQITISQNAEGSVLDFGGNSVLIEDLFINEVTELSANFI